jgi:hypothetical protein
LGRQLVKRVKPVMVEREREAGEGGNVKRGKVEWGKVKRVKPVMVERGKVKRGEGSQARA